MNIGTSATSGFLLPLNVYFRPTAFARSIADLAPELPEDFSIFSARERLHRPHFRKELQELGCQLFFCLIWVPLLLGLYNLFGGSVSWIEAGRGILLGTAVCVTLSVIVGLGWGIASGAVLTITLGTLFGINPNLPVYLLAFFVAGCALIFVGLPTPLGLSFGVGGSLMLTPLLGARWGFSAFLITTHLLFVPLHTLLSLCSATFIKVSRRLAESLWAVHPLRWDEIILFPLAGLSSFLFQLYFRNATVGRSALIEVGASLVQRGKAGDAAIRIVEQEARLVSSPSAIVAFKRDVGWLSHEARLAASAQTILPKLIEVSQRVDDALASESPTERARQLTNALDILRAIPLRREFFLDAIAKWSEIIFSELETTKREQARKEPIPQPYIRDGRPISPTSRAATAQPFKGREALFRQIESGIVNRTGEATTFLLCGQRRTGKTSLLLQLPFQLRSDVIPIFIDLQSEKIGGAETIDGLFLGIADEVRREAFQRGITLNHIDQSGLARSPYPTFGYWLDAIEKDLGAKTLLLCLDEVEALEEAFSHQRFDTRLLNTIRNIAQHRRNIAVLLSSSRQINELPTYWASALVNTNLISISFLEERDARDLIERPIPGFPEIYFPNAVDHIVTLTHSQPFLLQSLCASLVDRMNAQHRPPTSRITNADVDSVVPLVLERGNAYFQDLWRTQAGSDLGRRLLIEIAKTRRNRLGAASLRKISANIDEAQLRDAIQTLMRREIVEHTDDGELQIIVPLVTRYVRQENVIY